MIEFVVQLAVSPGMPIEYLRLLFVAESLDCKSGLRPPGLAIVSVVSLLGVDCMGWTLETPGILHEHCEMILG